MKNYEKMLMVITNAISNNEPIMIAKIEDDNIIPTKWITPRSVSAFEGGWRDDRVIVQVFANGEGDHYYDSRSYWFYDLADGFRIWNNNSEN